MRPISFVLLLAVPVVACSEPDARIEPAQVSWMEWPAEVMAATPFTVRLVGDSVACVEVGQFVTKPTVDQSAVTFEPYFLARGGPLGGRRPPAPPPAPPFHHPPTRVAAPVGPGP